MKHKRFDSVLPYSYYLVRKSDNLKYVGVRYANVKNNLTPLEDFGKVYFTSGKLRKDFKNNPENYHFRLMYTFDTIDDMFEWEKRVTLKIYKRSDWANQGWCHNYGDNPDIGKLISEGKNKIGADGLTSIERGADSLKSWIWETKDGEAWREQISARKRDFWENISDEDRLLISQKRSSNMDFKAASDKAKVTMSAIGEDGLSGYQRARQKAAVTFKERGTDVVGGYKRDARFVIKLGEMSDDEFEIYCAGKSKRFVNICKTRRKQFSENPNKYYELIKT